MLVDLRPEWGGRFARLSYDGAEILHCIPDTAHYYPEEWPRSGAYPLIPFHNRIHEGRFRWRGAEYDVGTHHSEPNALHGPACRPAWGAKKLSAHAALLTLDWPVGRNWPFAFRATQHVKTEEAALRLTLTVTNTGVAPMPAGLGWHPYFTKCTRIEVAAERDWVLDAGNFPTGAWQPAGKGLPTRYLSDWRDLTLLLGNGLSLRMQADALFSHLVIHDAVLAYSCVEPVSHLAGALNLRPKRLRDRMRVLQPGETLAGTLTLEVLGLA